MILDTAVGASPAFFSPNFLTRHADKAADLMVTSGSTLRHRLYDMDPRSRWLTAGSSDAIEEKIEFGLWAPGMQTARDFDYLAVMNHNVKEMTVERSIDNGVSWNLVYTAANIATAYTRVSSAVLQTADRLRVRMLKTQITVNDEKRVGGVIVAALLLQPSMGMRTYHRLPPSIGHKTAQMADRSKRRARIFRSDASFSFFGASISFVGVGETELDKFREIFLHGIDPFIFVPEPGRRPQEAFLCEVTPNTYSDNYMVIGRPEVGSVVSFDVEEVGGA